jgi:glutaminase
LLDFASGLHTLTQAQLVAWVDQAKQQTGRGRLPSYIPLLSEAEANALAVEIHTLTGPVLTVKEKLVTFPLMSVIKPFLLLFLLEKFGTAPVFEQVGREPSDQPFHSLAQLSADHGRPRNPMINSGAIRLSAMIPGQDGRQRCETLRQWLNQTANTQLTLDQKMLASVRSLANETNRSIANFLARSGRLTDIETTLDTYNHICCLSGTVTDLAQLGLLLVQPIPIAPSHQQIVNALMLTCGLYEASAEFAVTVGLPTKSGVSGALLAIVPRQGVIACYSPTIDAAGNSVAGLFLLETLAQQLHLSVFG